MPHGPEGEGKGWELSWTLTTPLVPEDQRDAPIELGELLGAGSFGKQQHAFCFVFLFYRIGPGVSQRTHGAGRAAGGRQLWRAAACCLQAVCCGLPNVRPDDDQRDAPIELGELLGAGSFGEEQHAVFFGLTMFDRVWTDAPMELGELLEPGSFVEQQHVACKLCVVVWPCLTGCGPTHPWS
jgi:hypothetical protein